ncbi:MAG: SBBP repeat-containing protein [Terriglobia bacterium]
MNTASAMSHGSWKFLGAAFLFIIGLGLLIETDSLSPLARILSQPSPAHKKTLPAQEQADSTRHSKISRQSHPHGKDAYGVVPLGFESNEGQTDPKIDFLVRGQGYSVFLSAAQTVFQWSTGREPPITTRMAAPNDKFQALSIGALNSHFLLPLPSPPSLAQLVFPEINSATIHSPPSPYRRARSMVMRLVGSDPKAFGEGLDKLTRISSDFRGNDPSRWRTRLPNFGRIRYHNVYSGIDLVYYGPRGALEYDFVVSPEAKVEAIRLLFEGVDDLSINEQGDLRLEADGLEILQHRPHIYQWNHVSKIEIAGGYSLSGKNQVAFFVDHYDISKPLYIDPELSFTFIFPGGGFGSSIVVDPAGAVYLAGTAGPDFPTTPGAFEPDGGTSGHIFVAKLNPAGTEFIYSTFLGGGATDIPYGLAVDDRGNAYVAGFTNSPDFPTTPGSIQTRYANGSTPFGPADAFISKLNPTGTALIYSTYLGGKGDDSAAGIAVDAAENAYVTGSTSSVDFPITLGFPNPPGAFQKRLAGNTDAFVAKLNPLGSTLVYSTYLGGSKSDFPAGIRLGKSGDAYVAGTTDSMDFPVTAGAFQTQYLGGSFALGGGDAFAARLNSSGTGLLYATYLGSSDADTVVGLSLDSQENLYISGQTNPLNYYAENFVKAVNNAGTTQIYSTHLAGGTSSPPSGTGKIELDALGNLYVLDSHSLKKLDPREDVLLYTVPFGGFDPRYDISVFALGAAGEFFVLGLRSTGATIYCGGGITSMFYDHQDAFLAKWIETQSSTLFIPIVLSSSGLNNSFFTSELTLTNTGQKEAAVTLDYVAAFGGGSGTASTSLPGLKQQIVPNAIEYLRSLGLPIPENGNRGGTLRIRFTGLDSSSDAAAMVRTTTRVSEGRAGLAYAGIPESGTLQDPVYLFGLRQNALDRSNVAVQNAGSPADGDIVVSLTVYSGDPNDPEARMLPEIRLAPGAFEQINGILQSNGLALSNGYVQVEKLSGSAPYYAYGVINDQLSSDGSFVPPTPQYMAAGQFAIWVPAVVESGQFNSEVILTNSTGSPKVIALTFMAQALQNDQKSVSLSVELKGGEQKILPGFVQYLREHGQGVVGPVGPTYVGTLIATDATEFRCTNLEGISVSARTSAPGSSGNYGVYYSGAPPQDTSSNWIYGLQQNAENRSNLALADTMRNSYEGQPGNEMKIELFDGDTGSRVSVLEHILLAPSEWKQFGSILEQYAPGVRQGYARVTRTRGGTPFFAYAVINDGSAPGERTGDGAFISAVSP